MAEVFANLPNTTVSAGGTTAPSGGIVETWTVASATTFPDANSVAAMGTIAVFHVVEDDVVKQSEIMTVTDVGVGQLTTGLTNGQTGITSLAVSALSDAITSGDTLYLVSTAGSTQAITAGASAAIGATSVTVNSFTANAAYAIGSLVKDGTNPGTVQSSWLVTRGVESTATVAHTAGFTVVQVISAGVMRGWLQTAGLAANNILTAAGSAPSNPTTGDLWLDTTNLVFKRWSGAAWVVIDVVTSVAGRTGAVILIADDIAPGVFPGASYSIGSNQATSVGLEIGSLTTSGQIALVDFHSAGTNTDYDSRISSSGSRALNTDVFGIDARTVQLGTNGRGAGTDFLANDGTNEGGQINLKGAASYGDVNVDNFQGNLRFLTPGGVPYVAGSTGYLTSPGGRAIPYGLVSGGYATAAGVAAAAYASYATVQSVSVSLINGRRYKVSYENYAFVQTVATDSFSIKLTQGITDIPGSFRLLRVATASSNQPGTTCFGVFAATTTGSVTIACQAIRNTGTGTLTFVSETGSGIGQTLLVEDIGTT